MFQENNNSQNFNIYYLNFSKVYEISMMINNIILSSINRENHKSLTKTKNKSISLLGSIGANSQQYLAEIKSSIGHEIGETNFSSQKLVESLDVKTTKSILLRQIVEKCIDVRDFSLLNEGDLVKINNIKLEILNEENLRQILMLRRDALKGLRVEGMEINNLFSSILQDYSYILCGDFNNDEKIVIKIPLEVENEFESKYNVDDLLIGHVSLIGVYKGKVPEDSITVNTFNYFTELGSKKNNSQEKIIKSNFSDRKVIIPEIKSTQEYQFIDIISIIQDISFIKIKQNEVLPWYKRFWNWLCNLTNETNDYE